MFRKLHIQLTAICTVCTAVIVIAITVICLYLSEQGMKEKEYGFFLTNVNSFYTHIQNEKIITMEWFQKSRMNGSYIIAIKNNGRPLSLVALTMTEEEETLVDLTERIGREQYGVDITGEPAVRVTDRQAEFTFQDENNQRYHAALFYVSGDSGYVSMTCVYPLKSFYQDLYQQRIQFIILIILAVAALGTFSYFFTGHVLKPIEKNRERQVAFIAAASHELRSPLTVIQAGIAAGRKADEGRAARFDEITQLELGRMERLVGDMLSLSRADASSWGMIFQREDLGQIVRTAVDKFQQLGLHKRVGIEFTEELPKQYLCWCDRQRIEQVLTILVDNGISHGPEWLRIRIRIEQRRKKWYIRVSDNGNGVPDEQKEKIFERFYRGDASHNSKEHFGLGLPIAREILVLHRGSLHVEDAPEGGACFVCMIPDTGYNKENKKESSNHRKR